MPLILFFPCNEVFFMKL